MKTSHNMPIWPLALCILAHFLPAPSLSHTYHNITLTVLSSFVAKYSATSFSSKFMDIVLLTDLHAEWRMPNFRILCRCLVLFFFLLCQFPFVSFFRDQFRCVIDDFEYVQRRTATNIIISMTVWIMVSICIQKVYCTESIEIELTEINVSMIVCCLVSSLQLAPSTQNAYI